MRDKIINILRQHAGRPVSGEELAKSLSVSRAAIWKHIKQLKQAGYDVRARYKEGYTLHASPDRLLPDEITARLTTSLLGRKIIYKPSVKSTNDLAKREAFAGCPHGTIVVAEEQADGRGRMSRGWFSPFGRGIWLSVVLRPPFLPSEAPKITLLTASALAAALAEYPGVKVNIKWPNDIIYDNKKLVGILTEMSAEMEAINYVVVGVGINISVPREDFPEGIKDKAASVDEFTGQPVERVRLLTVFLQKLEQLYERAVREGFGGALEQWRTYASVFGRQVRVSAPDRTITGEALDIDETGALLIKSADGGIERVIAGDVSVRALDGGYI